MVAQRVNQICADKQQLVITGFTLTLSHAGSNKRITASICSRSAASNNDGWRRRIWHPQEPCIFALKSCNDMLSGHPALSRDNSVNPTTLLMRLIHNAAQLRAQRRNPERRLDCFDALAMITIMNDAFVNLMILAHGRRWPFQAPPPLPSLPPIVMAFRPVESGLLLGSRL